MRKVYGSLTHRYWWIDEKGKRICNKTKYYKTKEIGPYEVVVTTNQTIVYHKDNGQLICVANGFANFYQVTDKIFVMCPHESIEHINQGYTFYNSNGHQIHGEIEEINYVYGETYIPAKCNGKWGYLDQDFNWRITPKYIHARTFGLRNLAVVQLAANKFSVIDKRGIQLFETTYCEIERILSDERFLVSHGGVIFGVVDAKGNEILSISYEKINFKLNHFIVKKQSSYEYGLYDINGKEIIPIECIDIEEKDGKLVIRRIITQEIEVK